MDLKQFRTDFTTRSSQETVFNPQHLLKAFELYDSQFDRWSWNQRDLFWRQVVGFVQQFLPANSAMDFAQGLYNRVEDKEKSKRSFNFTFGGAIFPPSFDSLSGLGYEYAGRGSRWCRLRCWAQSWLAIFKTYVEHKQRSWANYTVRVDPQQPNTPLCNSVIVRF